MMKFLVGGLKLWAVEGSALNEEGGKMPIVVLSHGMAGIRTMFSVLCCELASHGFLVAAVEHRYVTLLITDPY